MSDTTRIADLPENITMHVNETRRRNDGSDTSYKPIDVHPNPYGHPPPSVQSLPTPSDSNRAPPSSIPMTQQNLPSRDIPQQTTHLVQDPQVQPNYVPPIPPQVRKTTHYMKQYNDVTEEKVKTHLKEKEEQSKFDRLIEQGQIPILVGVLFFMFHMPVVDNYIMKYMAFLCIQDTDGNFNITGLVMKSIVFGGMYYSLSQIIQFLSEA